MSLSRGRRIRLSRAAQILAGASSDLMVPERCGELGYSRWPLG